MVFSSSALENFEVIRVNYSHQNYAIYRDEKDQPYATNDI
jgi:hypothetical protein